MHWLSQNYQWLFDGVGGAVLITLIGWGYNRWKKSRTQAVEPRMSSTLTAQGAKVTNSPVASGTNISQTINSPTLNLTLPAPTEATPAAPEEKEQPPRLSFVQSRSVLLHQSNRGVWHEASTDLQNARRGLVAQFRNPPNKVGQQAPKASSVTASLIFRSPKVSEELHINHGAWLSRFEHSISFHSGETHQLLLAVKLVPYVTFENPNTSNPFNSRFRSRMSMSIRQPQASALADGDGEVEITLVDAWNVTVFTGLFDYRVSLDEMYLKQKSV